MSNKEVVEKIRSVMKAKSGRLTPAGVALIAEGLKAGLAQATIAELLDITPAAVSYHARR